MDKDELINKLAELRDEMARDKRMDLAVIFSYMIAAVSEDMAEPFAYQCFRAISHLLDKRRESQLMLEGQVNEALAHIVWER
jgi:hypothetical protein